VIVLAVYQTADVEAVAAQLLAARQASRFAAGLSGRADDRLAVQRAAGKAALGEPASDEGGASNAVGLSLTLIDCSTGDPARLEALAATLASHGIGLLEAPLSGSSAQIEAGSATLLLGGDAALIERHTALLETLSPQRIHAGGVGMGARAKLATNLVLGLNRAVLAEGFAFAQSQGIAPAAFLQMVLATPARSDAALAKGEKMVNGDFAPQSRIHQHLKDVQLMLAAARDKGQGLPLSTVHAVLMQAAIEQGDGELDNAAILRQLLREKPSR
jgi:3-hydroxyisobutyrate dehydrogenase-like beta-hydroxyacid dehydrogenase